MNFRLSVLRIAQFWLTLNVFVLCSLLLEDWTIIVHDRRFHFVTTRNHKDLGYTPDRSSSRLPTLCRFLACLFFIFFEIGKPKAQVTWFSRCFPSESQLQSYHFGVPSSFTICLYPCFLIHLLSYLKYFNILSNNCKCFCGVDT